MLNSQFGNVKRLEQKLCCDPKMAPDADEAPPWCVCGRAADATSCWFQRTVNLQMPGAPVGGAAVGVVADVLPRCWLVSSKCVF